MEDDHTSVRVVNFLYIHPEAELGEELASYILEVRISSAPDDSSRQSVRNAKNNSTATLVSDSYAISHQPHSVELLLSGASGKLVEIFCAASYPGALPT